ncbi:MAG: transglutaminase domain-containing protein [Verrucomicrobiaceae bacterium]|nr:transglutaminase domain-containing protein [Verrucomicrobiaceae bacterium]
MIGFGGLVLAGLVALLAGLQKSGALDLVGLFAPLPEIDAAFQRGFRSDAISKINRVRVPASVEEVRVDEPIQSFLETFVHNHPDPKHLQLDEVFDAIQTEFPGAQYLAANLITSSDREELLGKLSRWTAVANPDFDCLNTTVFHAGTRLGALGVVSRRIPRFSLRAANEGSGRFFNRCPHCQVIHALELARESRTLILSCPHCELPFDILAAGTNGEMRKVNDFLEGFELEAVGEKATRREGLDRIVALWGLVADQCDYELDQDRPGGAASEEEDANSHEIWKTSRETWNEATGDCEDTSILLADVLIGAGFDARVAIGWNGNIGQHAWVVVRVDEQQYILESTLEKKIDHSDLVVVGEASAFYQPEQLFDREHIYYTTARPDHFRLDYFSPTLWKQVPGENGESKSEVTDMSIR